MNVPCRGATFDRDASTHQLSLRDKSGVTVSRPWAEAHGYHQMPLCGKHLQAGRVSKLERPTPEQRV